MRVGYACICLECPGLRCTRTTVLRNATPERLSDLIRQNLSGLGEILRLNEARGIRLFRIGNDLVPFSSHPINTLFWWEDFQPELRALGEWVRQHGHRLSFHTNPYTLLNSLREEVVENSLRDLTALARVFEAMELNASHKIILHGGVRAPDFDSAEARFEAALERVPDAVRARLVVENDDRVYPAERILGLCRRTGLPMVFDTLHHAVLPGEWAEVPVVELLNAAFSTWGAADGPPKIHFSSQDPDRRPGAHAYGIHPEELSAFLVATQNTTPDFDIMFECKGKDAAVVEVLPLLAADPRYVSQVSS
jgi:UV DNA damage endonuclease